MAKSHIIIVNYNSGDWLLRSVGSALSHSDGLVTVVDNNSTDDSVEIARAQLGNSDRLRWIENDTNRGFAAANNQVLEQLESEFAVLLNPDCEINAGTLAAIFDGFAEYPNMGLASCRILNEDLTLQATCKRKFPTPGSALVRMLQLPRIFPARFASFDYGDVNDDTSTDVAGVEFIEAISGAFMVVRRSALSQVGLLDDAYFMHCEDLDWCKRFALAGWQVGFVNQASVVHAKGVSSASRPWRVQLTLHTGMNRFFDKFYHDQYAWPTRVMVKFGIAVSFILKSIKAVVIR